MTLLTDTESTPAPKKTKRLPVVNKGDHVAVGRSAGIYSVVFANKFDKSWGGFHLSKNALEEAKALRRALDEIITQIEKEAAGG